MARKIVSATQWLDRYKGSRHLDFPEEGTYGSQDRVRLRGSG